MRNEWSEKEATIFLAVIRYIEWTIGKPEIERGRKRILGRKRCQLLKRCLVSFIQLWESERSSTGIDRHGIFMNGRGNALSWVTFLLLVETIHRDDAWKGPSTRWCGILTPNFHENKSFALLLRRQTVARLNFLPENFILYSDDFGSRINLGMVILKLNICITLFKYRVIRTSWTNEILMNLKKKVLASKNNRNLLVHKVALRRYLF